MADTGIEWTESTWNPVAGCTVISPGCTNCYAMRLAARLEAMGMSKYSGTTRKSGGRAKWTGRIKLEEQALDIPLRWRRPKRIFVNSMSDLFHDSVPVEYIGRVWDVMERANWHTFQILTKRPERMRNVLDNQNFSVLPNVWLGTSVENSDYQARIEELRKTRAIVRFISFEPLIGAIGTVNLANIDWAIVGGESGPKARPMEQAWVEDIQKQCLNQGTAFFFKQWGGTNKKKTGRSLNGRTWDQYPSGALMQV